MLQVCFNKVTYLLTCNFPGETFVDEKCTTYAFLNAFLIIVS